MVSYTVKNISNILDVNEETVRRWIRTGKLHSTIDSKKKGHIVEDSDFKEFVYNKPKYLKRYRKYKMRVLTLHISEELKKPEVREAMFLHIKYQEMILRMKIEAQKLKEVEG